jgi:hypothetical protein
MDKRRVDPYAMRMMMVINKLTVLTWREHRRKRRKTKISRAGKPECHPIPP